MMKNNTKSKSARPNLIRFDWAMKRLLRQKSNFTVLEGFLSVLLNEAVKIINITESEGNQEHPQDKYNRVDILVENSHNELMIIEIQNCEQADYFLRMLYGVSKAITEHISKGDPYSKVRKVYHINIVYFALGQGIDYVYYGSTEFRGLHYNDLLQLTKEQEDFFAGENRKNVKEVKDLFPCYYLLCVKDFNDVAKNSLDEWIYYLKNNDIPEHFTAPGLKEARQRFLYDKLPEAEKRAYDYHLEQTRNERSVVDTAVFKGRFAGKAEGLAEGLAKGKAEGEAIGLAKGKAERDRLQAKLVTSQKEVVLNSYKEGLPIEMISKITGLTQTAIIKMIDNGEI